MQVIGKNNIAMFDWPWSGIHFLSGVGVALGLHIWWQLSELHFWLIGSGLLIVWELYERILRLLEARQARFIPWYRRYAKGLGLGPETILNSTGDVLIGMVGMLVMTFLGRWH